MLPPGTWLDRPSLEGCQHHVFVDIDVVVIVIQQGVDSLAIFYR
ncbi:hypothetical protein [Vacuolonema iberomarrocanum]